MELKEITTALYDWAEQDNEHRSVICIATEKVNETEEGYGLSTSTVVNCKMRPMTNALVDMMKEDKRLADLVSRALVSYKLETKSPIVISINEKEEGEDE